MARKPKSKREFVDRMLSYDFTGDIRDLFDHQCTLKRGGSNKIILRDAETGRDWILTVSLPRTEEMKRDANAKREERGTAPARQAPRRGAVHVGERAEAEPAPAQPAPRARNIRRTTGAGATQAAQPTMQGGTEAPQGGAR